MLLLILFPNRPYTRRRCVWPYPHPSPISPYARKPPRLIFPRPRGVTSKSGVAEAGSNPRTLPPPTTPNPPWLMRHVKSSLSHLQNTRRYFISNTPGNLISKKPGGLIFKTSGDISKTSGNILSKTPDDLLSQKVRRSFCPKIWRPRLDSSNSDCTEASYPNVLHDAPRRAGSA